MKGKNFSTNNSSGKRKKSDFYETPYSLTRLLLKKRKIRRNYFRTCVWRISNS